MIFPIWRSGSCISKMHLMFEKCLVACQSSEKEKDEGVKAISFPAELVIASLQCMPIWKSGWLFSNTWNFLEYFLVCEVLIRCLKTCQFELEGIQLYSNSLMSKAYAFVFKNVIKFQTRDKVIKFVISEHQQTIDNFYRQRKK